MYRRHTRRRIGGRVTLLWAIATFTFPLLTAIVMVASVAVLHNMWWQAIPLIQYWPAYWFGVVTIGLGGPITVVLSILSGLMFGDD